MTCHTMRYAAFHSSAEEGPLMSSSPIKLIRTSQMSSARVERALREGKRLPPENLLLVGCGFAMASLCTLQSRPEGGPVRLSVEAEDAALAGGGSRTNNTVIGDAPTAHSGTEVCLALDVYILSFKNSAGFYV